MQIVVIGPPFEGTADDYGRLAQATGMVAYDLRTKIRPEAWGVLRSFADVAQAEDLAHQLAGLGYRVATYSGTVGRDGQRRIVPMKRLGVSASSLTLHLPGRVMEVPISAVLTVVRGEAQASALPGGPRTHSSGQLRAASQSQSLALPSTIPLDAYPAADVHFVTVPWIARIDSRQFAFPELPDAPPGNARKLDALCDGLAAQLGMRVDRAQRTSSVASFARQIAEGDVPFDVYSRLIGEAERLTRRFGRSD